jgi:hypothetical protein
MVAYFSTLTMEELYYSEMLVDFYVCFLLASFLLVGLFLNPEDGSNTSLRDVDEPFCVCCFQVSDLVHSSTLKMDAGGPPASTCFLLVVSLDCSCTLKMAVICSSETLVHFNFLFRSLAEPEGGGGGGGITCL